MSEAAALLGITHDHVRLLIRQGKLKAEKFGRDWAIDPVELKKLQRRPKGRPRST